MRSINNHRDSVKTILIHQHSSNIQERYQYPSLGVGRGLYFQLTKPIGDILPQKPILGLAYTKNQPVKRLRKFIIVALFIGYLFVYK